MTEARGAATAAGSKRIRLPWRAWSDDPEAVFRFPDEWSVKPLHMDGWPSGHNPDLRPLRAAAATVAAGCRSASIGIEDMTRPAFLGDILAALLAGLTDAGIADERIELVVALGAHGDPAFGDIGRKLGPAIRDRVRVRRHVPEGDLADTGLKLGDGPLRIDRGFFEAECRIGVGSVIPNPFAGFSGGGKIVLPGLASLDALEWLHKLAMMGFAGGVGRTTGNRIREEVDRVGRALPLHFSVNLLVDHRHRVREAHWGDPVEAHRLACDAARRAYRTRLSGSFDVLFCNAYPKDAEFLQAESAYVPLRTGGLAHLAEDGSIVLMAAAHRGRGTHGMFDAERPLHRVPRGPKSYLAGHPVRVFAPGISERDCRVTHWAGYPFFDDWVDLMDSLVARHGHAARAGIFPVAALQLGPNSNAS